MVKLVNGIQEQDLPSREKSEGMGISKEYWGVTPSSTSWVIRALALYHHIAESKKRMGLR